MATPTQTPQTQSGTAPTSTTSKGAASDKTAPNAVVDPTLPLGGQSSLSDQEQEATLRAEQQDAILANVTAVNSDDDDHNTPTFLNESWAAGHTAFLWHPHLGTATGKSSDASSYRDLKLENTSLLNVTPLVDGILKVGCVVIFGRGDSAANHAAMCIGFDPKSHMPIWVSDAVQNQATVNARSRNGEYTIYNPPAGFNASKAAEYIRALAKIRTDSSRNIIGTKDEHKFTSLCWQHVSMAISYALGHAIEHAGKASIAHGALADAGFTVAAHGNHGAQLDAQTRQLASASFTKPHLA